MERELDATEEKIINATFRIFQKEGIDKATTKKIAAEAGVNEVTIFRKFENKKNLVDITKKHFFDLFISRINNIFDYEGIDTIEEYLAKNFIGLNSLSDQDFSIIKVSMEEVSGSVPEKKLLISEITQTILNKLEGFFKLQIEKGNIRDVNARVLGITCFSVTFQSIILNRLYNENNEIDAKKYSDAFMDILYNGIKP